MNRRIVIVDDEVNILNSISRYFHSKYEIITHSSATKALEFLTKNEAAVVISDLRMPEIDGIEFLIKVKDIRPDTVRVMLTGAGDFQVATEAINKGNIFRFLNKPCSLPNVEKTINDSLRFYELIKGEKELLEKTLNGSLKVMTDILSLLNPAAFSRASRVRKYVMHIIKALKLKNNWEIEIAAALSQIGCVTLPSELINKVFSDDKLTEQESKLFNSHPNLGGDLVTGIPRMSKISEIIKLQNTPYKDIETNDEDIKNGAAVLKASLDFDKYIIKGISYKESLKKMLENKEDYDGQVLKALNTVTVERSNYTVQKLDVDSIGIGMVIDQDVKSKNGVLLVPKGQDVTSSVLKLLHSFANGVGVVEPIRVIIY